MICPNCNSTLLITNTQGVEIDYCPNCRGVWLDRGELDKIIERSNAFGSAYMSGNGHTDHHDSHYEKRHDSHQQYGNHSTHKKSFFSELFDF